MSDPKSFFLGNDIHDYVVAHGSAPDAIQQALIAETAALGAISGMQIAPEQGTFLTLMTALVGASFAVEIGTFTGYSALSIARGLAPGGRLLCCDISEEWTSIGTKHWANAGVLDRIDLRIAPALDTLRSLPTDTVIDLVFIDADKPNYANYFDAVLPLVRPNGLIMVDNVLWSGNVVNAEANDENTVAIRAFNDKVAADDRVEAAMIPLSDGLTLLRVR